MTPFLCKRATLALRKDNFSTPIEPPLQHKRASLTSRCYRLEGKEALFACIEDILQLSKPIISAPEFSIIDFSFVTLFYCLYDICIDSIMNL